MKCKRTKIMLMVVCAVTSFIALALPAANAQVTLTVGKGSALPGATESPVTVNLDNPGNNIASGMTMDVCDVNDLLECTGCETTDRTSDFSCMVSEQANGCCRVVLFSISSADIETGTGPIVTLLNDVSSSAIDQPCKEIRILDDVQIADASGPQIIPELQSGGFCFPCASDGDCDDGLYCTGTESCSGNGCVLDTNPCAEGTACVEGTDDYECLTPSTTTTAGPTSTTTTVGPSSTTTTTESSTTTTGPSTTSTTTEPSTTTSGPSTTTTTISDEPGIEVISDALRKSHWVAIPRLLVIKGTKTSFQAFKTTVTYDPQQAILKLLPIVLGDNYIWNIVLVMPSWYAGAGDQDATVTVTTDDEIVSDTFVIQELPFIFEQK